MTDTKGHLLDCYLKPRGEETLFNEHGRPTLNRYTIIPREEYESLKGELKEAREQQNAKRITIRYMPRDDGGLRIWADDLPGLMLSHSDPSAVWRGLGVVIENLLSKSPSASIRSQTIEECAKIAERIILNMERSDEHTEATTIAAYDEARDSIAKAIRSLDSNGGESRE